MKHTSQSGALSFAMKPAMKLLKRIRKLKPKRVSHRLSIASTCDVTEAGSSFDGTGEFVNSRNQGSSCETDGKCASLDNSTPKKNKIKKHTEKRKSFVNLLVEKQEPLLESCQPREQIGVDLYGPAGYDSSCSEEEGDEHTKQHYQDSAPVIQMQNSTEQVNQYVFNNDLSTLYETEECTSDFDEHSIASMTEIEDALTASKRERVRQTMGGNGVDETMMRARWDYALEIMTSGANGTSSFFDTVAKVVMGNPSINKEIAEI